jgi:hypothetical protein
MEHEAAIGAASRAGALHDFIQIAGKREHSAILVLAHFRSKTNDPPAQVHVTPFQCPHLAEPPAGRSVPAGLERKLDDHEVGKLLTTIDGVGALTAACLIAELGDPARFRSAGAIASYVGVAPRLRQSGKKRFSGSPTIPFGNARLRKALWMVVLNAVRCNPWLRQYYERLRAAGKRGKVAVIAAMRKLLAAVWSVATHRQPFVPHVALTPVEGVQAG